MPSTPDHSDDVVIGGGFYGCCLALFLRSTGRRVVLVEAGEQLLDRASRVNQARIHTGFHYPRSAVTAVKSMMLHRRFAADFPEAVVDNFQMLYAIARRRSKVSAKRFLRMFRDIGAPVAPANAAQEALFAEDTVEAVFACTEMAFDYAVLRRLMTERLAAAGVEVRLSTTVEAVEDRRDGAVLHLGDGRDLVADYVFNVTYAQINEVLRRSGLPQASLKYEIAELALIHPPGELRHQGITVMDGPFFSTMPYPADKLYSLTHVRYTPHRSWTDAAHQGSPYALFAGMTPETRMRHMILDSQRYVPCMAQARYERSIFDVKTVLVKNEEDDGRPILYQRRPRDSRMVSILGGKIDNIYDLFDLVRETDPAFAGADDRLLLGRGA